MKNPTLSGRVALSLAALVLVGCTAAYAQGTREDYQRAERFLRPSVDSLVLNERVAPNWIAETDRFWYRRELPDGKQFLLVDPDQNTRDPAFDHERLAAGLSEAVADTQYVGTDLPFDEFEFVEEKAAIRVEADGAEFVCDLTDYACEKREPEEEPEERRLEEESPDGKWVAFLEDHNVYVRSVETNEVIQLSDDGVEGYDYTEYLPSTPDMVQEGTIDIEIPVAAMWSPDSRRIFSYRLDRRSARTFTVVQSSPEDRLRPIAYTYYYALPGELGLTRAEPVIFDVTQRTSVAVQTEPVNLLYYGPLWYPGFKWSEDGQRVYFPYVERGFGRVELREADAETGTVRTVVSEHGEPYVDAFNWSLEILGDGAEVVWSSERSGWRHLYLYDGTSGRVKNRITSGPWVVRWIEYVDEETRQLYFVAGGREEGRDPYLRHAYRVGLNGRGLRLLTPEHADHDVRFSPTGSYFVDSYSRVDLAPVSVLRRSSDGTVVMELERADIERLLATGWRYPEPFKGKARDGETDIYGIIWRPSNLDTTKTYPIVEYVYTGPHSFHVPKGFSAYREGSQAIAELGFITVQVDGLGTNGRSREFNSFSYKNLGDGGLADRIGVIREMAARYHYMDIERVGIWGHSAGGYDATRAILTHPEFYDVAVSSAGNHDHRMDKAIWVEQWMGSEVGDHYVEQSNVTQAHRLEGKLFLIHGELDNNVHPASTMQVVDALIEANKDFDLLIVPNRYHGLNNPYVNRRRWDFFVRHLLGVEPPDGFEIGGESEGH
ncbi:MAG: DPP IV N-terminal domain-containing protein [Gemmatimonadales bacterium]